MHKPTEEQVAILNQARDTDRNLLISALAGAAKTSTLILLAEALPEISILCLAFNKKIATEMQERLPANCTAMTLNSLGHRTWSSAIGRRLQIKSDKGFKIMTELIESLPSAERSPFYERMGELMRIVSFGKACGYIPTGTYADLPMKAKRLLDDEKFFDHIEQELSDSEQWIVRQATIQSLAQAFQGICDYDDQILMPTVFHGVFPKFPLVLVDEAQDLSALNHAMLGKIVKQRVIAVGDNCQAIYGFRGAHEDSMALLRKRFDMKEMTLSISFRCPREVIKHAHWRTPNMRWPEWAKQGNVTSLAAWTAEDIPTDAAVLCRNNAPLFALAIKLLKNGRHVELGGTYIAKSITAIMRKFGSSNMPAEQVYDRIDAWAAEQKDKNKRRAHGSIDDRAECMRIFARQADDLGGALAYAQHLIQLTSPLKLSTVHKAKGLEFDHVFILNQKLFSKEEQDPNLRYVAITRAKETLTYVELDAFQDSMANAETV